MNSEDRQVTYEDLIALKDAILSEIRLLNKHQTRKWIKSKDVRKLLNISAGTLQTMRNNKEIPFTRVGGVIYYDPKEIDQYLRTKSTKYVNEK
ncbi:MAG: helix-turn-helix domain-containing protein [Sphingobacterium sp.]